MENECEALPGVAYPGVRDNRSTINTKTGYDDDDGQGKSGSLILHTEWEPCIHVEQQEATTRRWLINDSAVWCTHIRNVLDPSHRHIQTTL